VAAEANKPGAATGISVCACTAKRAAASGSTLIRCRNREQRAPVLRLAERSRSRIEKGTEIMQLTDEQIATTIARSHMAPSMRAILARRVAAGEQEARFAVYGLYLRQIRDDAKSAAAQATWSGSKP
jgi:hypothetical protein